MADVDRPQIAALAERVRRIAEGQRRILIGITGPPGAGKSTLAEALVAALGGTAVLVPMDGFHLAQAELQRLGRAGRKGAPDTFDALGYLALLRRLREELDSVVYAPAFRRDLEEPIAGAIPVEPTARVVFTEGNYLLVETLPPWAQVRPLLDEAWYVDLDDEVRLERLVTRHVRFGRSPEAARQWVLDTDEPNAVLVKPTRERADLVVSEPVGGPRGQ